RCRSDECPLREEAYNVDHAPVNRWTVRGGFPAVLTVIEDSNRLVFHASVWQNHADVHLDALPCFDGLEQAFLVSRLKPPIRVIDRELQCPIGKRDTGKVALLGHRESGNRRSVPLLIDTWNDLNHTNLTPRKRP